MKYSLGIDVRMYESSGIGTYLKGILGADGGPGASSRIKGRCYFGPEKFRGHFSGEAFACFDAPIYSVAEQLAYYPRVKQCAAWHAPHYNIPLVKGRARLIVTVHDLIHWVFRGRFFNRIQQAYISLMMQRISKTADQVIVVSQSTRSDLIRHFRVDPQRVSVVYEAAGSEFAPVTDQDEIAKMRRHLDIPDRYFLYVGLLKPHKNVKWLIDHFVELKRAGQLQSGLVIAGKADRTSADLAEEIRTLDPVLQIRFLSHVARRDLILLYNGATALVHPSLYEGFGLTLLEAMQCGTPVMALNGSSIPEVCGNAALLVEAGNREAFRSGLMQLDSNSPFRKNLSAMGRQQAGKFSWSQAAAQTEAVYRKVLG